MHNIGLGSWPARRARMSPDAVAVVHEGRTWTYAQLRERTDRLAAGLRAAGVTKGDRVAYLGPNHPVYLDILFACGLLGAVFVPINFRLTAPEVGYVLADSGARLLIHTPACAALAREAASVPLVAAQDGVPLDGPAVEDVAVGLDEPCLIMYTSGSTGKPKGAVLTHGNLTWNALNVIVESDFSARERALVVAPLFHIASLSMTCLPTLLKGGRVLLHSAFDPGEILAAVERDRATLLFGVPTMFNAISAHPRWASADLSSVRQFLCGGAAVAPETIRRYTERGVVFVQGYGMTETAPGAVFLPHDQAVAKAGTAGVPSFFTDVRVVRPDGSETDVGERGEVIISGPNVMPGYWERPEATADVLREGWFHSGDIATRDTDGYLAIVDRVKDLYISGGENVYPAEVENELYACPGVAGCAVIGVSDETWGEVGRAIVVPSAGVVLEEAAVLAFLRERLASFKVPKSVIFVDSLPTTGSGKVRKDELRKRFG